MTYPTRRSLYQKVEEVRERPLIVYATSHRRDAQSSMSLDVIPEFTRQMLEIPEGAKKIDLLVVSSGGDPTVSWRIICMLRERFENIGVIIPYIAYSAATLLALGADEIIMHPFSNLGPVDPQMRYILKYLSDKQDLKYGQFSSEDLKHFLEFVRSDVGITNQQELENAFELLCNEVGPIPIGIAKRSTYLSLSMGEKLLSLHMKDKNQAKAIAEAMNTSFYHHGYPLGRKEAKSIGLPIKDDIDAGLEKTIWSIWMDIEEELQCNKPFNELEVVLGDESASKILRPVKQIPIPPNVPPAVIQQVYAKIIASIIPVELNPVDYEITQALVESTRGHSEYRTKGMISATRLQNMNIKTNKAIVSHMWHYTPYELPGS